MSQAVRVVVSTYLLTVTAFAQSKSESARISADNKRLDVLVRSFTGYFDKPYWDASKRLADERGTAIISAVMVLSRKWQGEEDLFFVPLIALLPRKPTLALLQKYQESKRKSDRLYAQEFIVEFDMSDTMEAVQSYENKK